MLALNIVFSRINWNLSDKSRLSVLWRAGRVNISNSEIVRKPNIWRLLTLEVTQLIKYWLHWFLIREPGHPSCNTDTSKLHYRASGTRGVTPGAQREREREMTARWQDDARSLGPVSGDSGNYRGEAAGDISLWRIGRAHNIYMTAGDNNYTIRLGIWNWAWFYLKTDGVSVFSVYPGN